MATKSSTTTNPTTQMGTTSGDTSPRAVKPDADPGRSSPSIVSVHKRVVRGVVQSGPWAAAGLRTTGSAPGKPLSRLKPLMMDSDAGTGIGDSDDSMAPKVDQGVEVSYGVQQVHVTNAKALSCSLIPNRQQQVSTQLTGTFYVYHVSGHGQDGFLVVYKEDGLLTTSNSDHPLLVSMGPKWDDLHAGTGFVLQRMDTGVAPSAINGQSPQSSQVSWVSSSPATVNKEQQVNDQTVESFNQSVTLSAKEGPSTTFSHDYQIWHSTTMSVKDWAIQEQTDASSNKCSWSFYQNIPWSGLLNSQDFPAWWQLAYNMGGGWDDVKAFSELSTGVMQYHTCAAWLFANPNPGDPLKVTFSGQMTANYCLIAMPQLGGSGHHLMSTDSLPNSWSVELDLVALAQLE